MIILKDVKQLNEIVNNLFKLKNKFEDNDYSFIDDFIPKDVLKDLEPMHVEESYDDLEKLSLLIFQLKNYIPALCNATNLLLITKSYESVYYFVTRIFYEHIGTVNYTSNEKSYNYMQRLFDRFIETVKNCHIDKEDYIPFLLNIFEVEETNKLSVWQEPALEYLKRFEVENTDWVNDFIYNNEQGFTMLSLLCYFSTQKGIKVALDYYKVNKNDENIISLFKDLKKELLLYIDKNLQTSDENMQNKFAKILFSWGDDSDAKSRLEEIYKSSNDALLRNEIAHKIGTVQLSSFKSEKNFLFAVRRNAKQSQERTLGLPFDRCELTYLSGLKADFESYTYLINIFKEENNLLNLEKFLTLNNVFVPETLNDFANKLFYTLSKKQDVNCAKWAIRLICLFANQNIVENFVVRLFDEQRIKEGKYILSCLIYARKDLINLMKRLSILESFKPYKNYFVTTYSQFNNLIDQEVREQLLPEEFTEEDTYQERKVLYENFIAGRQYQHEYFEKLFIKNRMYNTISQDIVFGEYKYGRLYSAFILNGRVKTFVYGGHIDDSYVAIIHTIDCDERTEHLFNIFPNSKFNQFEKSYFNVNNFSRSQVSIQSLTGTVVNPKTFCKKLEKYDFVKNKESNCNVYSSLIHKMPLLNLICEVEFDGIVDETDTYKTLSNIYFYRLSDCISSGEKYITYKQNAVSVGSLPPRYFSHILTAVTKSTKEN